MNPKENLKLTLEKIYSKFSSKRDSFEFFAMHANELGIYGIDYARKAAKLRDEKTASTHFLPYLKYNDFGGDGKVHDIIHLMMEAQNISFPEAVRKLAAWANEEIEFDYNNYTPAPISKKPLFEEEKRAAYNPRFILRRKTEAKQFKEKAFKLLKGLCRSCSGEEFRRAITLFEIGYSEKYDRLFIPEIDNKSIAWGSFSYNRELTPKGLLRKNSKRVLFGSHLIEKFDSNKPLIFAEGHSDCIVNNAKGYASVTTGSATTPLREWMFPVLEGRELHFYPDADEAGLKGVLNRVLEIEEYNKSISEDRHIKYKIFWWSTTIIKKDNKVWYVNDLVEIFQHFCERKMIEIADFKLPEAAEFKNWKIMKKDPVKAGYDFIDFHSEHQGSEKYSNYMAKYSFL